MQCTIGSKISETTVLIIVTIRRQHHYNSKKNQMALEMCAVYVCVREKIGSPTLHTHKCTKETGIDHVLSTMQSYNVIIQYLVCAAMGADYST